MVGLNLLVVFLAWKFFSYVDYILNMLTPESFSFDFAAPWASLVSWREPAAVANFILLVSVICLALAIFRQKRWTLIMGGIVGLVFVALLGSTYINWVGVAIVILLLLNARRDGVDEIDQRTKINSKTIIRRSAPSVVMAFFVLVSFAAFQSPVAKGIAEAQQLSSASRQILRSIVESVVGGQIPAGPEKESIINQVAGQTFKQINDILRPYFQYAPPLLAFGLFLILWGFSWLFVWLSVFLGMLIFWILKKTKMVRVEEKDIKAEVLVV